jgi:hypothetical protein
MPTFIDADGRLIRATALRAVPAPPRDVVPPHGSTPLHRRSQDRDEYRNIVSVPLNND